MMKLQKQKSILCAVCLFLVTLPLIHAQNLEARQSVKYEMRLVCVADTNARESIFVIGSLGFKSLASLKQFAGSLPSGAVLEWAPDCRSGCDAPFLSSKQEIDDFTAFCKQKGVEFVFVPSG